MRHQLDDNGKLIQPASLEAAVERSKRLSAEIDNIMSQLRDRERNNIKWRIDAVDALDQFQSEKQQLAEWIDVERDKLITRANDLFRVLVKEGTDFTQPEIELMKQIESYLAARTKKNDKKENAS